MGILPLAAGTASAVSAGPVPKDLRPGGSYDRYVAQLAAQGGFSGSLLIAHQGKTVLARAYGWANKRLSIPNQVDTIFALASVAKLFTGLSVVQLAQQGKLDFGKTLGTYLDGFPAEIADVVTIHQLLIHTSGMGDYMQDPSYQNEFATWRDADEVTEKTLAIIRKSPLLFTPGTTSGYSNSGYAVLDAIVAKVSGRSYRDYVREHIFAAAGMTGSDFYTKPQWQTDKRIAHPYALQPSRQRADTVDNQVFSGAVFSTAGDMSRFAHALYKGKLIKPAFAELYMGGKAPMAPRQGIPDPAQQLASGAYGGIATIFNNQRIFQMNGSAISETMGGITTTFETYPDLEWSAVVLNNYDQVRPGLRLVQHAITDPLA